MNSTSRFTTETGSLDVPGARLSYDVCGNGPPLLLIPGGASDARDFERITPYLAGHFTVARYDPRGISRSHLQEPPGELPIETHADDAHRLLAALGDEPAIVFGSSGGAAIGLALTARYPGQVRTLVAHEPPLVRLLPEGSPDRSGPQEVYDAWQQGGVGPAMQRFIALTRFGDMAPADPPDPDLLAALGQRMTHMQQNVEFFLASYLLPVTGYLPDLPALQERGDRIVVGIGEASSGELANDTARALASRLGQAPVTFPGGHSGYFTDPHPFAERLRAVFGDG